MQDNESRRILLVANDPGAVRAIRAMLAENTDEIRLLTADRLSKGLQILAENEIAAIILDLFLPDLQGLEALKAIRRQNGDLPIIVIIDLDTEPLALEALDCGAQDYLVISELTGRDLVRTVRFSIERRNYTIALEQSRAHYRMLAEISPDAVLIVGDSGIEFANRAALDLFGADRDEQILGMRPIDLIHPEDQDKALRWRIDLAEERATLTPEERRIVRLDGRVVDVELSATHMPFESRHGLQIIFHDITVRKQAERDLRMKAQLLDAVGQAVVATDHAEAIVYWNQAAERLYGWRSEEVLGKQLSAVIRSQQTEAESEAVTAATAAGEPWTGEYVIHHKEGHAFPVRVTITPIRDRQDELTGVVVASVDLTERRVLEAALRSSREEIETSTYNLGERVKELTTLHELGRLLQQHDGPIDRLLQAVVATLPGGWQFPDIAAVRLSLGGREFTTENFAAGEPCMTTQFDAGPGVVCRIELVYTEPRPGLGEDPFLPEEYALIETTGKMLQTYFDRRRVGDDLLAKLQELELLHRVSSMASEVNEIDSFLTEVTKIIAEAFYSDHFGFGLYDPRRRVIRPHTSYHGIDDADRSVEIPVEGSVTGRALSTGKPVRLGDVLSDSDYFSPSMTMRSELAVPIIHEGIWLGVINAESREPDFFTYEDERLLETIAGLVASALNRMRLFDEIRQFAERQAGLRRIDRAIASRLSLPVVLEMILDEVCVRLDIPAAEVLVFTARRDVLVRLAARGLLTAGGEEEIPIENDLRGQIAIRKEPAVLRTEEEIRKHHIEPQLETGEPLAAFTGLPLVANDAVNGILCVYNRLPLPDDDAFHDHLELLAGQAALAIDHARVLEDLRESARELKAAYESTIEGWSRALSLRDDETVGHSRRVTDNTMILARAYGLSEEELAYVRHGALLHDIGKMGVPDRILFKENPLTDDEWELMKMHPAYARKMLSPIRYLEKAVEIPTWHHERWDGTGYPDGLKGEEIPVAARLFAIVDVWDALTSDRPYRSKWSRRKSLQYITDEAGKHFDPEIVDLFIELLNKGDIFPSEME